MSVLHHIDPNGTERIRIYCSRKGLQQPCIQEYIQLAGLNKKQTKAAWAKAHERDKELQKLYASDLYSHPWNLKDRVPPGRTANYFVKVRSITLTIENNTKGGVPDWGRSNNYYWFSSYPPSFTVAIRKNKKLNITKNTTKRFYFRSNRQMKQAYKDAVEFLLTHRPQYKSYHDEMVKSTPRFNDLKDYLDSKYLLVYGVRPWK